MKNLWTGLVILVIAGGISACRKTTFISSADALFQTSTDTLHFDTVFTTTGSVTQAFKIFNSNDQKLRLSSVKLMGGATSAYRMNVDGTPGINFGSIELEPNDSIYVFVSVTVNPSAANLPFIVQDSILINYNGNSRFVQLQAFGQNANFYRNRRVTKDSTWNSTLPFVILGGLTVDSNVTLTINKGTRIYCHADAPIVVNGTLKVNGDKVDRVAFQGDRIDPDYRDFPGSWPGIYFNRSSKDNVLNFSIIKNAYQGIVTQLPSSNGGVKVTLNECMIDNIYDAGILCLASTLNARNCLITNCGNNIGIAAGGIYTFTHCTVASYGNSYLQHKTAVLYITDANGATQTNPLTAAFRNCIFYGEGGIVDDEVFVEKKNPSSSVSFQNVLYKATKNDPTASATFIDSYKNLPPQFDSIDVGRRFFDFRINNSSTLVDKGVVIPGIPFDFLGNSRVVNNKPDLGCYERQP